MFLVPGAADFPLVSVREHDGCAGCRATLAWLSAMDRAHSRAAWPGPFARAGWIRDIYEWGPISWPVHWCDLPEATELDCGVFSEVVSLLLSSHGVQHCRLQLIQRATTIEISRWRQLWRDADNRNTSWIIGDGLVYHEAVASNTGNGFSFFDSTAMKALPADDQGRSGDIVWIRTCADAGTWQDLRWGDVRLPPWTWVNVGTG